MPKALELPEEDSCSCTELVDEKLPSVTPLAPHPPSRLSRRKTADPRAVQLLNVHQQNAMPIIPAGSARPGSRRPVGPDVRRALAEEASREAAEVDSEEVLLQKAKNGDREAARKVHRKYCQRLQTVSETPGQLRRRMKEERNFLHLAALSERRAVEGLEEELLVGVSSCFGSSFESHEGLFGPDGGALITQDSRVLLENKVVDVHAVDDVQYGWTALHVAAKHNAAEMAKLLLEFGGRDLLFRKDVEGRTALHVAAGHGREEVAIVLLHHEECQRELMEVLDNNDSRADQYPAAGRELKSIAQILFGHGF